MTLLRGDGSLYWCGGMRLAWSEASRAAFDFYLWLNDDTMLLPGSVAGLLDAASSVRSLLGRDPIIVGSAKDPDNELLTFGGKWLRSGQFIQPTSTPQPCDSINGNIVLIPKSVFSLIGTLSEEYTHAIADHDYSLRACRQGVPVYIGPGYYGLCKPTDPPLWVRPEVPFGQRWRALNGPKGILPQSTVCFCDVIYPVGAYGDF